MQAPPKIELPSPAGRFIIHRPPMLLINELLTREGDTAAANATITEASICFDEKRGILPEFFIEIIAQTMAAANGYDVLMEDTPPPDGFLVGLNNFVLHQQPARSGSFLIKIAKTFEFGAMKVMHGEVFIDDTIIASGELQVWEQPAP